MDYSIIKYGQCHCINKETCISKYIDIFVPYKPEIQRVKICSEYFRLLIGEQMTKHIISKHESCQMFLYSVVISDILNELVLIFFEIQINILQNDTSKQ